jgi:hypothetical protein
MDRAVRSKMVLRLFGDEINKLNLLVLQICEGKLWIFLSKSVISLLR